MAWMGQTCTLAVLYAVLIVTARHEGCAAPGDDATNMVLALPCAVVAAKVVAVTVRVCSPSTRQATSALANLGVVDWVIALGAVWSVAALARTCETMNRASTMTLLVITGGVAVATLLGALRSRPAPPPTEPLVHPSEVDMRESMDDIVQMSQV